MYGGFVLNFMTCELSSCFSSHLTIHRLPELTLNRSSFPNIVSRGQAIPESNSHLFSIMLARLPLKIRHRKAAVFIVLSGTGFKYWLSVCCLCTFGQSVSILRDLKMWIRILKTMHAKHLITHLIITWSVCKIDSVARRKDYSRLKTIKYKIEVRM